MRLILLVTTIFGLLYLAGLATQVHAQLNLPLEILNQVLPPSEVEAQESPSPSPTEENLLPSVSPSTSASPGPSSLPSAIVSAIPSPVASLLPIGGEATPSPTALTTTSAQPTASASMTPSPTPTASPTDLPAATPTSMPIVAQTDTVARNAFRKLVVPALSAVTMTEADEFYKDTALPNRTAFILSVLAVLITATGISLLRGYDPIPSLKHFWDRRTLSLR